MASRPMRLALALLLTALLAGTAALAAAGLGRGDAEVPDRFPIAAPREGDAWNYTITDLDGGRLIPPGTPNQRAEVRLDVSRTGPIAMLDADGQPHVAQGLDVRHIYAKGDNQIVRLVRFATSGEQTLSRAELDQFGGESDTSITGVPAGLDALFVDAELQSTWTTTYGSQAPCGHWSSLQGSSSKTSSIQIAGCRPQTWKAIGMDAGLLVLQGKDADGHLTQVSFSRDVPVPVRVLQPAWWNATLTVVWTLHSFTPGHDASAAPSLPAAAPAVSFAPRQPFGPDETGVDHPFPLSAAYGLALASGPLADYFARHPAAYLQSASYAERVDDIAKPREHTYIWTLQATDGETASKVEVVRTYQTPNDDGLETLVRQTVPVPPNDAITALEADAGPFPQAGNVPPQLATVASVMARAQAYNATLPSNAWGFSLRCADATCTATRSMVVAGHDDAYREGQNVGVSMVLMFRRTAHLVGVDDTGATVLRTAAYVDAYEATTLGPYTIQGGEGDRPAFLQASQATGPAWSRGAIAGGTVLGIAAVAFGVKLLLGLWHRSTGEHPLRTQLLQLLEAEPGLHHQEIMRRLGKGNSVVAHHLRALERDGRIVSRQGPRYRCYFLAGLDPRATAAIPLVKTDLAQRILDELAKGPCTGQELAQRLGVAPSSIAFHVRRFQTAHLLIANREGRLVKWTATDVGRQAAALS